jgi:thiol-disulfide isomerase/thioredoxin
MSEVQMKKKKSAKREIIEWVIFLGIIAIMWATGLHTPVIGFIQGLVLKTGIVQPNIEVENPVDADFNMMLTDRHGNLTSLKDFQGKVIFINIWATWCPPCIAEMPDIHDLYQEIKNEDVVFVMLSVDDDLQKAISFVDKKGFEFPVYQLAGPMPLAFESSAIPTTFVISPEGKIVVKKSGMAQYNSKKFREYLLGLKQN